jgi:hypothetical protein
MLLSHEINRERTPAANKTAKVEETRPETRRAPA